MRRIQVSLDDRLWAELDAQAQREGTAVSEIVRQALRDRYPVVSLEERRQAMMGLVGSRKGPFTQTVEEEVRNLRTDRRLERIFKR